MDQLDPVLAQEVFFIHEVAREAKQRVRASMPEGWLGNLVHQADVNSGNASFLTIAEWTRETTRNKIRIFKDNREQAEHLQFYFNHAESDAYTAYLKKIPFLEFIEQQKQHPASLASLRPIGKAFRGEAGRTDFVLFDSTIPEKQLHGMSARATLMALGFSSDEGRNQLNDSFQTDPETGVTTATATVGLLAKAENDTEQPAVGRSITVKYTKTGPDVSVVLTVDVTTDAPEIEMGMSEWLKSKLIYEIDYACGSHWPNIPFKHMNSDELTNLIQKTKEFEALGGKLTTDQKHALQQVYRYKDYEDHRWVGIRSLGRR